MWNTCIPRVMHVECKLCILEFINLLRTGIQMEKGMYFQHNVLKM